MIMGHHRHGNEHAHICTGPRIQLLDKSDAFAAVHVRSRICTCIYLNVSESVTLTFTNTLTCGSPRVRPN